MSINTAEAEGEAQGQVGFCVSGMVVSMGISQEWLVLFAWKGVFFSEERLADVLSWNDVLLPVCPNMIGGGWQRVFADQEAGYRGFGEGEAGCVV